MSVSVTKVLMRAAESFFEKHIRTWIQMLIINSIFKDSDSAKSWGDCIRARGSEKGIHSVSTCRKQN